MIEYPYEYGRGRNKESFMYRNIEKSTVMVLKDQIRYQDGQIVSKTLVQNNKISMTLFSFEKGEEISTHAAGGDAMVIMYFPRTVSQKAMRSPLHKNCPGV